MSEQHQSLGYGRISACCVCSGNGANAGRAAEAPDQHQRAEADVPGGRTGPDGSDRVGEASLLVSRSISASGRSAHDRAAGAGRGEAAKLGSSVVLRRENQTLL